MASRGTGHALFAPVCVDGRGPYPFMVDTGAGATVVDSSLARQLSLSPVGTATKPVGVGCVDASRQVDVLSWSVGSVGLSPQTVLSAGIPGFGTQPGQPAGVLGGDVLSRFGAVRLDFGARLLTPLAPEAAAPAHASLATGDTLSPPPPLLVHGTPKAVVALTVLKYAGLAVASAATSFGGSPPDPFSVDTGSAVSGVSSTVATARKLVTTGRSVPLPGLGCSGSVGEVRSGPWQAGTQSLSPQALAVASSSVVTQAGVKGWLGEDVLSGYGSVVLDYRTGLLWLGAG